MELNPYESPSDDTAPATSNIRGGCFGCLYIVISWIALGFVAALLIPTVFHGDGWNHEALGTLASQISFILISVPLGIFGFIRHRRKRQRKD